MKKIYLCCLLSILSFNFIYASGIINTLNLEQSNTHIVNCHYVKMADGHEYIVSTAVIFPIMHKDGAGISTSIIHAAGCKKCMMEKQNNTNFKIERN